MNKGTQDIKGHPVECKLTKIRRDDNIPGGMRTDIIEGTTYLAPVVGKSFCMFAAPLEAGDLRYIETTVIKDVQKKKNIYIVRTESGSIYKIQIFKR
jgi:hypothetical protein